MNKWKAGSNSCRRCQQSARSFEREACNLLEAELATEIAEQLAGLPPELDPEEITARQFDLELLTRQLALLRAEPVLPRLQTRVREIAELLVEKESIPMVGAQIPLIQEIQTDEFWADTTLMQLETVRKWLRDLVKFIEKSKRKAYGKYLAATQYNATQIRFVNQIIDHLTENGVIDVGLLYEQPFTNFTHLGPEGRFPENDAADIVQIPAMINRNASWELAYSVGGVRSTFALPDTYQGEVSQNRIVGRQARTPPAVRKAHYSSEADFAPRPRNHVTTSSFPLSSAACNGVFLS